MTALFTHRTANKTLPLVKRIVGDILQYAREYRIAIDQRDDREALEKSEELKETILALIHELEELGCYYKDWNFDMGLVDFPAVIDGQDVYLCWRSDEDVVSWYHSIDGGFDKRKPIPSQYLEDISEMSGDTACRAQNHT